MERPLTLAFTVKDGGVFGVLFQPAQGMLAPGASLTLHLDLNRRDANEGRTPGTGWPEWILTDAQNKKGAYQAFPRRELETSLLSLAEPLLAVLIASETEAQFAEVDKAVASLAMPMELFIMEDSTGSVNSLIRKFNRSFS